MNVRVNTDENDLINILNHYIKNKDIAKLMFDTLNTNSIAIEWLFKLHIGNKYPKVPEIGTCGYIKLSNYESWQGDKDKYLNSSYCEQGYIKVTVKDWRGLSSYYPLIVEATPHSENNIDWNNIFQIDCKDFITVDEFDVYDVL